jgi:hypothetical protein
MVLLGWGCASPKPFSSSRPFVFHQDSFAFANDTVWDYHIDPVTGKTTHTRNEPTPSYTLHCFVVARSARQFFQNARFDASQPPANAATYRRLIQQVVSVDPSRELSEGDKIVIPGYSNLYVFSQAQESLLKAECGGAWQSYFQRGHWRMIFPFSQHHQEQMAAQLLHALKQNRPPIVHVVRFPGLGINHAIVLFAVNEAEREIEFTAYDPNSPDTPLQLIFNRGQRCFLLPANHYFAGGRVDVYQVYCGWDY